MASLGSDHASAGASQAPELRQEVAGIPALSLGSRLPRALRAGSSVLARPGEPRPRRSGAHGRALQPERSLGRVGASETPAIPEALALRSSGSAAEPVAADVRRRLPIPGWVWEAERRAQREPGAAQRGGARTPAAAAAPWRGARGF